MPTAYPPKRSPIPNGIPYGTASPPCAFTKGFCEGG
jgi:hypothetical protein